VVPGRADEAPRSLSALVPALRGRPVSGASRPGRRRKPAGQAEGASPTASGRCRVPGKAVRMPAAGSLPAETSPKPSSFDSFDAVPAATGRFRQSRSPGTRQPDAPETVEFTQFHAPGAGLRYMEAAGNPAASASVTVILQTRLPDSFHP